MLIIWILLFVSGVYFLFRIFDELINSNSKLSNFRIYLYLSGFAVYCLIQIFLKNEVVMSFLFTLVVAFAPQGIRRFIKSKRHVLIRDNIVSILDELVLRLRVGGSLRESIAQTSQRREGLLRLVLDEIYTSIIYPKEQNSHADPLVANLIEELKAIDKSAAKSVQQLQSLRSRYKTEERFRRKSGRALAQVRAQSFILSILYFCLLVGSAWYFGFRTHAWLYLISFVLFALGLLWVYLGGRSLKWKV